MRTSFWRAAKNPRYGPPKERGMPKLCPSPTTMSAPSSPGAFRRPSATGSWAPHDHPGPGAVGGLGQGGDVLDDPEEVGVAATTAAVSLREPRQSLRLGAAVGREGRLDQLQVKVAAVGGHRRPVLGVQGGGEDTFCLRVALAAMSTPPRWPRRRRTSTRWPRPSRSAGTRGSGTRISPAGSPG